MAGVAGMGALGAGGGCARHAARSVQVDAALPGPSVQALSFQEFLALPAAAQRDRVRLSRPFVERSRAILASLDRIERARQKPWGNGFVREPAGGVLEAVAGLQSATRLDPSNGGAWCELGRLNAAIGRPDSARVCLERCRAATQASREARKGGLPLRTALASAWVCRELAEYRAGLNWAEEAVRLDPDSQKARLIRGLL